MANEEKKDVTGEVVTLERPVEAAPAALPTKDELKAQGWTADGLERGEKAGLVAKPAEPKKEGEPEKKEPIKEEKKAEPEAKPKPQGGLPDLAMTPEKEAEFKKIFPPGTPMHAFYFRMLNERRARQALERKVQELESRQKPLQLEEPEEELLDKPLTPRMLKEIKEREDRAAQQQHQQIAQRQAQLTAAQTEQEDYVRSVRPDFDETVELAKDLIQNLDTLVTDEYQQDLVTGLIEDLRVAAANADKIPLNRRNAAYIAHEIGRLHPKYGQKGPKDAGVLKEQPPKAAGGLTPGQMRKVEESQRRAPSAAIPDNGGQRVISVDDVDAEVLNAMTLKQRQAFKDKYPEKYAAILNG